MHIFEIVETISEIDDKENDWILIVLMEGSSDKRLWSRCGLFVYCLKHLIRLLRMISDSSMGRFHF